MKLGNFTRMLKGDYPKDYDNLISIFSQSYNKDMEAVYQALSNRLTFSENLLASEKEVDLQVNVNGTPLSPTFVKFDFNTQVKNLYVTRATNLTNSAIYPTSAPWISWNNTENGIQIVNVKGLPIGSTFRLRLVLFS